MPSRPTPKRPKRGRQKRNGRLRPQDEAFCQAIALQGASGTQAYRDHMAMGKVTHGTAQVQACKLLALPIIRQRVAQLRAANNESIEERLGAGREQAVRYLVDAWQTPLSEIGESSPLAQSVKKRRLVAGDGGDEQGEWEIEEVKSVSKLDALEKLAKMAGWYPQSQSGGAGAIPAIVINLGAMYSPALGEESGNKGKTMEMQTIAVRSLAG